MIRIALAEDNYMAMKAIEEKLTHFTDIEITHRAQNGAELLELISVNPTIELILMDIDMPIMHGIQATEKIKQQFPAIKIVMITIYDDDESIFNAIKAGADSYILKETKSDKLYETILDTLNGGAVMSPSIALKTLQLLKSSTPVTLEMSKEKINLSERETEILEQISKGFTNKRIAENLHISPFTVKRHIENIYQRLQAHNRIELLEKARKNGFFA